MATPVTLDADRRRVLLAVGLTVIALVPVVVAIARMTGRTMVLQPDTADMDLLTRDVFGVHVPLIGMPGRFGFNHPGPLLFYGLAPTNLLAGAPWGTQVGGALLQGVAVVWAARLAYKRGGLVLQVLVLATVLGTYAAAGSKLLLDAWNPNPPVPFLIVFLLQVWSVAVGDRWRLVGAAVTGSFLVQTHALWGPPVAAALAWLVVVVALDWRRDREARAELRAPVLASAGAALVLWLPAFVDEVVGQGNLMNLVRYTLGGEGSSGDTAGWEVGARLVAAQFRLPPPWLTGDAFVDPATLEERTASLAWLLVPAALLVAGAVLARRARDRPARLLVGLVAVLGAAALVGGSRLERPLWGYLLTPRITFATLLVASVAWLAVRAARDAGRPRLGQGIVAVAGLALVVGSVGIGRDVATRPLEEAAAKPTVLAFADRLERAGTRGPVLVRDGGFRPAGLFDGLFDELDRRGLDVRVDEFRALRYGPHRAAEVDDVDEVWVATDVGSRLSDLSGLPDARVVALASPLSRAEEDEARRIQRRLLAALDVAGRDDLVGALDSPDGVLDVAAVPGIARDDVARLAELNRAAQRGGGRRGVVAFPSDSPSADAAGRYVETELVV